MAEYCSFCAVERQPHDRKFAMHHIAREINNPLWITRVCSKCHRIWDAWHYTDRNTWDKNSNPSLTVRHHAMVVGQARCIELLSYQAGYAEVSTAIQGLARGYLLLASEMDPTREPGDDGEHPKPDSTNPAQAPKLVNGLNCQRVLAAQAGIEAYLFEEVHGLDHPIARILRLLEQYPLQVGTILSRYRVEIEASFANGVPTIEYLISLAEKVARQLPATLQSEYRQGVRI